MNVSFVQLFLTGKILLIAMKLQFMKRKKNFVCALALFDEMNISQTFSRKDSFNRHEAEVHEKTKKCM
jgi:hypothetical protein